MLLDLLIALFTVAPTVTIVLLLLQIVITITIHMVVTIDMDIVVCGNTRALNQHKKAIR